MTRNTFDYTKFREIGVNNMQKSLSEKEKSRIALIIVCSFCIVLTACIVLFTRTELKRGDYTAHKCKSCSELATWKLEGAGVLRYYCENHSEEGKSLYKSLTGKPALKESNTHISELAMLLPIILSLLIILPVSCAHFKYSRELDLKEYVDYIGGTTLYLKKRGPLLSRAIKISAHRHYSVSYKPDEYIYTGASSGGISMGSVEKIDGYNYISSSKKTGQYFIEYSGNMIDVKLF